MTTPSRPLPDAFSVPGLSVTDSVTAPRPTEPRVSLTPPPRLPIVRPCPPSPRRPCALAYRPPRWHFPDSSSPSLHRLLPKALSLESLSGVSLPDLEDLLYVLSSERKSLAQDHRFRDGDRYNGVVSHVRTALIAARKRARQQLEQADVRECAAQFRSDLDSFDKETKSLEADLRARATARRETLSATHERELADFLNAWQTPLRVRRYNRASNRLTILRRQLAFLLVQCRFRDAEEVQRLVDEETREEGIGGHAAMQRDYDRALATVLARQREERESLEEKTEMQLQKFAQDRAIARRIYENRGKKLTAREEMAADSERLWNHEQGKRAHAVAGSAGLSIVPSAKMARRDIPDKDVAILCLPPLASRMKAKKPLQ